MAPKLYLITLSPPARAVQMTARAIGLDLELAIVDLMKGEHLKPEYLKINPQHTVPTLVDKDGFILWDSHAIMSYIVQKYGKDDSLYPTDLRKRAIINHRLHFENGILWPKLYKIGLVRYKNGKTPLTQSEIEMLEEIYGYLNIFLKDSEWMAGDYVSIADFSLIPSLQHANIILSIDSEKFPKLASWLKRVEELPAYEANKKGLEAHKDFLSQFFD